MNQDEKTLILKGSEVRSLLDPRAAIEAVAGALASHARGETQMPSKVYISMPDLDGDFRAMPVRIGERAGVKWINAHPQNPARHGLPSVIGVFILSDAVTARPLAIMDAMEERAAARDDEGSEERDHSKGGKSDSQLQVGEGPDPGRRSVDDARNDGTSERYTQQEAHQDQRKGVNEVAQNVDHDPGPQNLVR